MKLFAIYAVTVGILTFAAVTALDRFHIAEHSSLRAAIVGGVCNGIAYLVVRKLIDVQSQKGGGVQG